MVYAVWLYGKIQKSFVANEETGDDFVVDLPGQKAIFPAIEDKIDVKVVLFVMF